MNELINILIYFFSNALMFDFSIYCWILCKKEKIKLSNSKFLVSVILMAISAIAIDAILPKPIRFFSNFVILYIACYFTVNKNSRISFLSVLTSQLTLWFSEFTFVIIASIFGNDNIQESINSNIILFMILNIYIFIISILLLKIKLPQKLFALFDSVSESIKNNEAIAYTLMIVIVIAVSTTESYMQLPLPIILTTNVIMTIIFIGLIIMSSTIKSKYNNINSKYETSITSLREYEGMIDKYRISNHENKNELLTLRNLISKKNTKALKYIDEIINDKIKDNEKIMYKTSKIPEGGLRATIYAKLCTMDELGIKYSLDIAKDIRTVDLINMKEDIVLNICKILGVFLDNAIEAVKDLKTKHIGIEIYLMDGDLCVDITNKYEGKLDMNKIGNSKYTTKGGNHGYGLSLVNQIISDYPDVFENEKSITKNTFTQKIKIKM